MCVCVCVFFFFFFFFFAAWCGNQVGKGSCILKLCVELIFIFFSHLNHSSRFGCEVIVIDDEDECTTSDDVMITSVEDLSR